MFYIFQSLLCFLVERNLAMKCEMKGWKNATKIQFTFPATFSAKPGGGQSVFSLLYGLIKFVFQLITSGEGTVSNDSFVYFSFEKPFFCFCGMFLFCTEQHLLFSVFTHLMSTINLSASLHILRYLLSFPFIISFFFFY